MEHISLDPEAAIITSHVTEGRRDDLLCYTKYLLQNKEPWKELLNPLKHHQHSHGYGAIFLNREINSLIDMQLWRHYNEKPIK